MKRKKRGKKKKSKSSEKKLSKDNPFNFIYRWKETYDLSFELADVTFTILNEVVDYCIKHDIPLKDEQGLWNLVTRARNIFSNIEQINSATFPLNKLATDAFLQRKRTDEDLTEPHGAINKGGYGLFRAQRLTDCYRSASGFSQSSSICFFSSRRFFARNL